MVIDLLDLRIKDDRCQVCVEIETSASQIRVVWQDLIKNFLQTRMVKVEGEWQKVIELFPKETFPKDEEEVYALKAEENK